MIDLTARQVQILRAIIEEYIQTAEPVGSDTLDKKFNIGVSPATIRNEMVYLTNQGYLQKTHSSAGRAPTPLAMKLYVNELMKERELTVAEEVSTKQKVWQHRDQFDELMHDLAKVLAERTRALGITVVNSPQEEGYQVHHSGYANLFSMPEFEDHNVTRNVLELIEEAKVLEEIFNLGANESQIRVVYGAELGGKFLDPVCVIYTTFQANDMTCNVGVIGSWRFDYSYVAPMLRYVGGLAREFADKTA
jgi:heat-inducible transcriptional repressor